jgi:hypothetical protein
MTGILSLRRILYGQMTRLRISKKCGTGELQKMAIEFRNGLLKMTD